MSSAATGDSHSSTTASARTLAFVYYTVLVLYLVVTLSLSGRYQYSLYPDATSYLSIAQAYARGQFWDAVNGYWAPLYCVLMAPLFALGVDPLLAPKLLALAIGAFTLLGLRRLCRRLRVAEDQISIVLIAAVLPLICWSLTYITPDFLLVGVLTWYLAEVVGRSPTSGVRAGLTAGAIGGFAYLSKQYALPFVTAHLALAAALQYHQHRTPTERRAVGRWVIAAYVALLAVAGPWIAVMSTKYGRLTVASSGTYNWYLPSTGFNVGTRDLAPPPFPGASSAWVDPTPYAHTAQARFNPALKVSPTVPRWWGFKAAFEQLQRDAMRLERFSFLALPILVAAAVLAVRELRRRADYRYAQLLLAFGVYLGGYQIVTPWIDERLVWILVPLLALLGALLLERLVAAVPLGPRARVAAAVVLALSFWPLPALRLAELLDDGRDVYSTAKALEGHGVRGRLASLNSHGDSMRVAFLTRSSYYGRIGQPATLESVLSDLRSHEIDYLLIWAEKNPREIPALHRELEARFPDATRGQMNELVALDVRGITTRPVALQERSRRDPESDRPFSESFQPDRRRSAPAAGRTY